MARSSSYTYNPQTGKWTKTTTSSSSNTNTSGGNNSSNNNKSNNTSGSNNSNSSGNLTSSTGDSKTSTGSTEQKYNYIEINTLVGQLSFIVTEETIKLKAGDTVKLAGLGKYLSGKYYVKEMNRVISNNGYSHSAVLIKTDFGDSLKSKTSTQVKAKKPKKKPAKKETTKKKKTSKPVLTEDIKKHVAAAIWNGNYGWYNSPTRVARLTEVFGANNGIQAIVNKGYNYIAGISPSGYSYNEMKAKFKK